MVKDSASLRDLPLNCSRDTYFKDKGLSDLMQVLAKGNSSSADLESRHNTILLQACKDGFLCMVKYILSQTMTGINCRGGLGRTPVMMAARYRHAVVFDFLVSFGCDIEARDDCNSSVLHVACMGGSAHIIRKLLQLTRDKDARGEHLWTPVMVAAIFGHGEAFNLLVSKSCDMSLVDSFNSNILHLACQGGNVDIVRYILSQNITDINARGHNSMTPWMFAVSEGHRRVYDFLKENGCDLLAVDDFKQNALHIASTRGKLDMVKYLISERKYDIESLNINGWTPVMIAVIGGHTEIFDYFAGMGVDLKTVDRYKNNIIHIACQVGNVDMVRHVMLKTISAIDSRGCMGMTPVMIAAQFGYHEIIDLLRHLGCNFRHLDERNNNILHIACMNGHIHTVQYVLTNGIADIDSKGYAGRTSVMLAAERGYKEVVELLVKKGCNPRTLDEKEMNILHVSCVGGNVDTIKYILSLNIGDVDSKDSNGMTPVMFAAVSGNKKAVQLLISEGCNLRIKAKNKQNILHIACKAGHMHIVSYLLSNAIAIMDSRDTLGRTPVMIAAFNGHKDVVKLLHRNGCNMRTLDGQNDNILHVSCMCFSVDMVKYILSLNIVDVDSLGLERRTPVMIAARLGHKDVVTLLVNKGSNLRKIDKYKYNILHVACLGGHVDLVKYILSLGVVDIDSKGYCGRTPVLLATEKGQKEMVQLLFSWNCNIKAVDAQKNNIFHVACEMGHLHMVRYLLKLNVVNWRAKNVFATMPKQLAERKGHKGVVALLLKQE